MLEPGRRTEGWLPSAPAEGDASTSRSDSWPWPCADGRYNADRVASGGDKGAPRWELLRRGWVEAGELGIEPGGSCSEQGSDGTSGLTRPPLLCCKWMRTAPFAGPYEGESCMAYCWPTALAKLARAE